MTETPPLKDTPRHLRVAEPSPWVARWAGLVRAGGQVLDVAAGGGRHARLFLERGCAVTAVDRDIAPLAPLAERAELIEADLENGGPWPLAGRVFDAVVVVNYLHRPLMADLVAAVAPGGVLIYETFARGNETYARPRNPDHLLEPGELIDLVHGRMSVVAYEHGIVSRGGGPLPGVVSRICAARDADLHPIA